MKMNVLQKIRVKTVAGQSVDACLDDGLLVSLSGNAEKAKNGQLNFGEATRSPKNQSQQIELSSEGTLKVEPEGSKPSMQHPFLQSLLITTRCVCVVVEIQMITKRMKLMIM